MTSGELIAKARRSAASAKVLFDVGDMGGAFNRAYYAMFDAARAALLAVGEDPRRSDAIKTHSGLITAFSLHLIKSGRIPTSFGRTLRQAEQIRALADYSDTDPDRKTAGSSIDRANQFVDAVVHYIEFLP